MAGGNIERATDHLNRTHVITEPLRMLKFHPIGGRLEVAGVRHTGAAFAQGEVIHRDGQMISGGHVNKHAEVGVVRGRLPLSKALAQVNAGAVEPWTEDELIERFKAHPSYGRFMTYVEVKEVKPKKAKPKPAVEDETEGAGDDPASHGIVAGDDGNIYCGPCDELKDARGVLGHMKAKKHLKNLEEWRANQ